MNDQESTPSRYKALILGDTNVGKSSVLLRYERDAFRKDYDPTIGVDFIYKELIVEGQRMNWRIWDTAGQEKFRSIVTSYLRALDGVVFCFDVTSQASFTNIPQWVHYYSSHARDQNVPKVLLGNKAELASKREVTFEAASKLASSFNMPYFDVSASTGANVPEAFNYLAKLILNTSSSQPANLQPRKSTLKIVSEEVAHKKKKCC